MCSDLDYINKIAGMVIIYGILLVSIYNLVRCARQIGRLEKERDAEVWRRYD